MENKNSEGISQQGNVQSAAQPAPQSGMDFSKTTIIVLVVLTLLISTLGTWTVLEQLSNAQVSQKGPEATSGEVKLNIVAPDPTIGATGHVTLNILK